MRTKHQTDSRHGTTLGVQPPRKRANHHLFIVYSLNSNRTLFLGNFAVGPGDRMFANPEFNFTTSFKSTFHAKARCVAHFSPLSTLILSCPPSTTDRC